MELVQQKSLTQSRIFVINLFSVALESYNSKQDAEVVLVKSLGNLSLTYQHNFYKQLKSKV